MTKRILEYRAIQPLSQLAFQISVYQARLMASLFPSSES